MATSARAWTCPPIIRRGEYRYRDRSRPIRKRRSTPKMTSPRYSKKLSVDDGAPPSSKSYFHHRGAEFAEFGVFLDYGVFTPRTLRLRGEFSRAVAFYVARFRNSNGANPAVLGADFGRSQKGRRGCGHRTAGQRDARCAHPGFSKEVPRN